MTTRRTVEIHFKDFLSSGNILKVSGRETAEYCWKINGNPGRSREVKEFSQPEDPVRDWIGAQMAWDAIGAKILAKKGYAPPKIKKTVKRFTEPQVREIVKRFEKGESPVELGREFKCHPTTIRKVVKEAEHDET